MSVDEPIVLDPVVHAAPPVPRAPKRRRPSGASPPLPHHLQATGVGWLIALIASVFLSLLVFAGGIRGLAVPVTEADDNVVRWVSGWNVPGLDSVSRVVNAVGSFHALLLVTWGLFLALAILRRWRHLIVAVLTIQVTGIVAEWMVQGGTHRPRPFAVEFKASWDGWAMPSMVVGGSAMVGMMILYTVVPEGRVRSTGKWVLCGFLAMLAFARIHLGVETPTEVIVGAIVGATLPLLAFRLFTPNDLFPIAYKRGRRAHLDVTGARGTAIRQALEEQLGIVVDDIRPFGLSGSAGSTPLLITCRGQATTHLFGKLYARSHLLSDRWYKLGRELLYGRLEDEKPFNTVRRLVQQEDYALRLMRDAGLPSAEPFGFVELTPEREYMLVTEFFEGAAELGDSEVNDAVIDDGLSIIRKLWDAGLAHRDVKPANLLVRNGRLLVIDVAFAEVRPTPWRQAVDLANMMLCLALRSSAEQVYERALRQFTVAEITEGFAAAQGLALPSQLRRALKKEGRNLHAEFFNLLPAPPQPMKIQRWSARRVGLLFLVLLLGLLLTQPLIGMYSEEITPDTHIGVKSMSCRGDLEPLWLEAQAVPTASAVPCVDIVPEGWRFEHATANSGRATFIFDHDRAGLGALKVRLARRCDPPSSINDSAFEETIQRPIPGGCIITRVKSTNSRPAVWTEVRSQINLIVGAKTRADLKVALDDRSDGRLRLDPKADRAVAP